MITAGCFSIVPTQRIAACGWLMIGVPMIEPKTPGLVIVKVPFWTSSGLSFLPARPLAQVVDRPGQAEQRELIGVLHDRDDEAPVERHGDAEVDVAPEDGALARTPPR